MITEQKPTISIITVVYNGGDLLARTINSIRRQKFKNIEYIIIDGGSADTTLEVIKANLDMVNFWVSESDEGLYDAMNKGLKAASGKYVWFINAGDEIYDEYTLAGIFDPEKDDETDIYYGSAVIIDSTGQEVGLRRQKLPGKLNWRSLKNGMVVSHQSFIVKRSIAPNYNLRYKCSADIDWVIASLKIAVKIVNTQKNLSRFLEGGRSRQTIIPSLKERFVIMTEYYGLIPTLWYHIPIAFRFFSFLLRNNRF
jgi:glycosyltransferase involved in cell wall biosynthesis